MINRDHLHVTISNHNYPIPRDNLNQYHVKKLRSAGFMDHLRLLRSDCSAQITGPDKMHHLRQKDRIRLLRFPIRKEMIGALSGAASSGPSLYKDGTIAGSLSDAIRADSRKN